MERDEHDTCIDDLKLCIQKFRERQGDVDIDRITRFAIYEGHEDLVRHLVEKEGAKLKTRDTRSRSAIFYAAKSSKSSDLAMLKYVADKVSAGSKIALQEE